MVSSGGLVLFIGSLVAALITESIVLRAAKRWNVHAIPNARSSHSDPTPTMGGLAITIPVVAYLLFFSEVGNAPGIALAVFILSLVGLLDDLKDLSATIRLLFQLLSVVIVIVLLELPVSLWTGVVLGFLFLWHVNLYNFMDGIDGLAGSQALLYCMGALILGGTQHESVSGALWVVAGASAGFLVFNWPPARIFMGDVGALLLGLLLPVLAVDLAIAGTVPIVSSAILLSAFWFDASYTLTVRALTRQPFLQAHRSHLYQKIAGRYGHRSTTTAFIFYAVLWLLPLGWTAKFLPGYAMLCLVASVLPQLVAAVLLKAGVPPNRGGILKAE